MGAGPESNARPEPPPSFAPEDSASITSNFLVGHADLQPVFLEQKNLLTRVSILLLFVPVCDRAQDVCAGPVRDSRKSAAPLRCEIVFASGAKFYVGEEGESMTFEFWLSVVAGSSHPGIASSAMVGKRKCLTGSRMSGIG